MKFVDEAYIDIAGTAASRFAMRSTKSLAAPTVAMVAAVVMCLQ
jgi:hypothetical protein